MGKIKKLIEAANDAKTGEQSVFSEIHTKMHLERSKERNKPVFLNSQTRYVAASLVTDTQTDRQNEYLYIPLAVSATVSDAPHSTFQGKMREHLRVCFERSFFVPFLSTLKRTRNIDSANIYNVYLDGFAC